MRLTRIVIKNFRSFSSLDLPIAVGTTCVIGENNTGKSNFLHAIRLCLDAGLSSTYRRLLQTDLHTDEDFTHPNHVLVGIEIADFAGKTNEEALVGAWQIKPGLARLFYRFRPKLTVREDLATSEINPGELTLADYHWEIMCGGDGTIDLADIDWDTDVGHSIRFGDLQSFLVQHLPALRDVESDLRNFRSSPLARLIEAMEVDENEQADLLKILGDANDEIAKAPSIEAIANAIDASFKKISGPAFSMDVGLGVAAPTFHAIIRALRILLSNIAVKNFDPATNGLGLNNILYLAILIEYFLKRIHQNKSAGQLILLEEPEAHLHPQLQLTLFKSLSGLPIQSILTTHSTHITASAGLSSYLTFTQTGVPDIHTSAPAIEAALTSADIADLERYLDATKSNLLFARKVMLVEGPAELFLIPPLIKEIMNIDLDREGISVIPIYGVHFEVYSKLFGLQGLPKKCAIVTDGDLVAADGDVAPPEDDMMPPPRDLAQLENSYVKVFACHTTFERALALDDALPMFATACEDLRAPRAAARLRAIARTIKAGGLQSAERTALREEAELLVLNSAKRFGKARFAQVVARHVGLADEMPAYIASAVEWLMQK